MNFTNALISLNPDYPYDGITAKYGIDANKLSEDYNRLDS
jgi:hypothetical protein